MFANRVKETTTTTGIGNLTLAGAVTNFRSFNTAFGTNRKFIYWIIDDTNNVWETGVGYLSASTTLVRQTVLDNSSGGASALNLSAGTKTVMCSPSAGLIGPKFYRTNVTYGKAIPTLISGNVAQIVTANQLYLWPFRVDDRISVSSFKVYVEAAVAGSKARCGIYALDTDGEPGALIAQSGDISTITTGLKSASITAVVLEPGFYVIGFLCSHGVTTTSGEISRGLVGGVNPFGGDQFGNPTHAFYDTIAGGWSVLPDPPVIDGALSIYEAVPVVGLGIS